MQRERKDKQNKPDEEKKEGYIIVTNYFLKKWVKVLGVGPVVLYEELLTYCHKGKYIAWPTINSLCQQMGIAKTTLLRYQDTLIKFGLIKNITRGKSTTGHYRNNIYQITPLEELTEHPDPDNIIDFLGSKMKPDRYQNDTCIGSNMKLSLVSNRYPNNTNLNSTNATTTNRENVAVVAVVNFKKLKEKGEEKMQAIRERMVELDFKEEFIEKILKEYSTKKIEEKIDLLMERKNIQSPAGWLRAALKNDYQDREQERYDEEPVEQVSRETPLPHLNSTPSMGKKFRETIVMDSHLSPEDRKIQSRERVLKMIRKTQKMLANLKTKGGTNV
ncbi:hypothetical protein ES703_29839 [subsurface metagenome]